MKRADPSAGKARLQAAFVERYAPTKVRSVFVGDGYALRFSEAKAGPFSGTVLSLSALRKHDDRPFVVVVARAAGVDFLLANATFLRKVSHSSRDLQLDRVRGSFNGGDIVAELGGVRNCPENFERLFALHEPFTWEENLARLVEATSAIVGRGLRFEPTAAQRAVLTNAPERAREVLTSRRFLDVDAELAALAARRRDAILAAAQDDNVNVRGNAIEGLLTGRASTHGLGDITRELQGGGRLVIDVKSKLRDRGSAPKAYNVDKMLALLAEPGTVFAFFLVGVDRAAKVVTARLIPVLDEALLEVTTVQHHWSGRGSRGVTQLTGRFDRVLDSSYQPTIDVPRARAFLGDLLAL